MRVSADTRLVALAPGESSQVTLDVVNTGQVIDGVSARIIGIPAQHVTARPAVLPLFPDTAGTLTLTLDVPATFPAGRHPLTVEVASQAGVTQAQHVDLDLDVAPRPELALRVRPPVARGRRRGRFMVEVHNRGNVALDCVLFATDPERVLKAGFSAPTLSLEPGAIATSILTVRAPRHGVGNDLDRLLTLRVESQDATAEAPATFRQRPMVPRGVLTAVILASIVALWAAAFLIGLTKVFGGDPMTKTAPASFFVAGNAGLAAASSPGDVLAKNGPLPPGVGGVISGTVRAASTGDPVGRIVVEALRRGRDGPVLVGSAASQADGTYAVAGLFPGDYLLRFSATGYTTTWYPAATSDAGARTVSVGAQQLARGIDATVTGLPASITGQVDPGDTLQKVVTTVVARPLTGDGVGKPAAQTSTDANGGYHLSGLAAPATYELSFTAPGYQPTTVVEKVGGGQQRYEPTVRLSAGVGTITGTVTDGRNPLGGVTVTTTVDGNDITTGTPTLGAVGQFVLGGLPTPATYILTFVKDGYGAQTVVVDLGPGQQRSALVVPLIGGTGTVSGQLVDASGNGLGGATVTVGGTPQPSSTTTLTTGKVGVFAIAGLPTPGSYTLTFSLPGYAAQTVPVTLDANRAPPQVTVTMTRSLGTIAGQVLGTDGAPYVGATVTVTDGAKTWKATSVGAPTAGQAGSYLVTDLPAGSYAVTVTADGFGQLTALVTVVAGSTATADLRLQPGAS